VQTRAVQITFTLICLVVAAAAQELVPAFGGTKAPVLALFAVYTAFRPSRRWMPVAVAAGAFEDALSGSPTPCCTFFTLLAATGAHFFRPVALGLPPAGVGICAAMVVAPVRELWLSIWGALPPGCPVLVRFFASALPAAAVGALVFAALPAAENLAGFTVPETGRRQR
jgi:hypothetical protein